MGNLCMTRSAETINKSETTLNSAKWSNRNNLQTIEE